MLRFARQKTNTRILRRNVTQHPGHGEEGQGLVEALIGLLFLLLVIIVTFEMLFLFMSYMSLMNAAAQGAIRAAGHPDMVPGDAHYTEYIGDIQGEVVAGGLDWNEVGIHPPELPPNVEAGEPITVTIDYTMTTPFSEIFMPMFGRFGLPSEYHITARTTVPIR
jgi:hypothetical protein